MVMPTCTPETTRLRSPSSSSTIFARGSPFSTSWRTRESPHGDQRKFRGGEKGVDAHQEKHAEKVERAHICGFLTRRGFTERCSLREVRASRSPLALAWWRHRISAGRADSPLRGFARSNSRIVLRGFSLRHAEDFPVFDGRLLGEVDDLADVVGDSARFCAPDGLQHGMWPPCECRTYFVRSASVSVAQGVEAMLPAGFPLSGDSRRAWQAAVSNSCRGGGRAFRRPW